jgi:hypothetical protein
VVDQAAEPALLLDPATRARIRKTLAGHSAAAWAPKGIDCLWWSRFAKGQIEIVPLSRFRTIAAWFPALRILL